MPKDQMNEFLLVEFKKAVEAYREACISEVDNEDLEQMIDWISNHYYK